MIKWVKQVNIALIMAGGVGVRLQQDIPKQFLNVFDKPIIIYTLKAFQHHPEIDKIVVSCLDGWQEILRAYGKQFGIDKMELIVTGGEDGQTSGRNAILQMHSICKDDDIVIIHDAIRPMVSEEVITECIFTCKKYGSGIAAIRFQDTIMKSTDGIKGYEVMNRNSIMHVQTPQAYQFSKLVWAHEKALEQGIRGMVYMNAVMSELGETLYFSRGSEKNIKIMTLADLDIFKALYHTKKEDWWK